MENEYPKMLYKADGTSHAIVATKAQEEAAAKAGYVTHDKRKLPEEPAFIEG